MIIGNIELLKLRLPTEAHTHELIDTALRAALHARDLTSQLLAFSRQRQLNPRPTDVNDLIAGLVRLLGRTLGREIRVKTAAGNDVGVAFVDAAALEAALLNIALNARDAMPGGGVLTIRTSKRETTNPPPMDDDLRPGV